MAAACDNYAPARACSSCCCHESKSKVEEAVNTARTDIANLMKEKPTHLAASFLKLAFYDAGTYDPNSNGSIRLRRDLDKDVREAIDTLGVEVVNNLAKEPTIKFEPGRMDSYKATRKILPSIVEDEEAIKVREIFNHIGFNDREIVALSWAYYFWETSKLGIDATPPLKKFDNSYYKKLQTLSKDFGGLATEKQVAISIGSHKLLTISCSTRHVPDDRVENQACTREKTVDKCFYHWKCLLTDKTFRKYVHLYASNPGVFKNDYVAAHQKMTELGLKEPKIYVKDYHDKKKWIFVVAIAVTILVGVIGFLYSGILKCELIFKNFPF